MIDVGPDSETSLLRILLVDDEPERHGGLSDLLSGHATLRSLHPADVTADDLADIDLVSVDEYFDDGWFAGLDGLSASLRNEDGLAVAAAFMSHARTLNKEFAVSLHSGELARLAAGLPSAAREPLTAAQHDLDWVFAYGPEDFGPRVVELARGVRLATDSSASFRDDAGASWLRLPGGPWNATALDHILACRPPAHGLAENTGGRSYLRWLVQRVLPYPSFLYDNNHASNLLGISIESFGDLAMHPDLASVRYEGPMRSFCGTRWWRAGLLSLLSMAGSASWQPSDTRAKALSGSFGIDLEPLKFDQTVVTYDAESNVVQVGADVDESMRINVDGWPVFADDPWALRSDAQSDAALLRLASPSDRDRA
jgi:hypothetical protein